MWVFAKYRDQGLYSGIEKNFYAVKVPICGCMHAALNTVPKVYDGIGRLSCAMKLFCCLWVLGMQF